MDQGLTQNWLSYYHDVEVLDTNLIKNLYKHLYRKYKDYFIINTVIDKEEVIKRINNRLHGTSRIDNLDKENQYRILEVQITNFAFIRSIYPIDKSIILDTLQDEDKNVKEILEFL